MIDVRSKKEVTTRKEHKCHLCNTKIEKGNRAVVVKAKEDNRHITLYLHPACNIEANRIDLFDEKLGYSAAIRNTLDDTAYPF